MKEYLKKFIFFIILSIVAAIAFRMALPKTINVHIIGNISTTTDVTGSVNANVSGLVDTKTKLGF
jgi:phage-related protein